MPGCRSRIVDRICRASLLLFVCMAGYGISHAAQEGQGGAVIPGPSQPQGAGQMRRTMPGVKLKKMGDMPSLNAEQKKKMKALTDEELGQMKTLREDRSLTREQKQERFKQIREATREKIKGILTPEQRKKYEESLAKERTFRENLRQEKAEKPQH
jgi:periplasmic protein CpxP/Spy